MKKNNNKGFTLVELIAVLTLLLVLATIAIVSITATIERNRGKQRDSQIKIIESKGLVYYKSHINSFTDKTCIKISEISTLTEEELKDPNGGTFTGSLTINSDKTVKYEEKECE